MEKYGQYQGDSLSYLGVTGKSVQNGINVNRHSHSPTLSVDEFCKSYKVPLSDQSSETRSIVTTLSQTSSNEEKRQVRKIISRRETSFYRKDAKPVLQRHEVQIQLKAVSVSQCSNTDINKNTTGEQKTYFNFSGLVNEKGGHVSNFGINDPVFGFCEEQELYSDYVVTDENNICACPRSLSFDEAATIASDYIIAWVMLHEKFNVQPGDRLLIRNASVNVGLAACQLAKLCGLSIYAFGTTEASVTFFRKELKIDNAYNHFPCNYSSTSTSGCDLVTSHNSHDTEQPMKIYPQNMKFQIDNNDDKKSAINLRCMAKNGIVIPVRATHHMISFHDPSLLYSKDLTIKGLSLDNVEKQDRKRILELVAKYITEKQILPYLMKTYPIQLLSKSDGLKSLRMKKLAFGNSAISFGQGSITL